MKNTILKYCGYTATIFFLLTCSGFDGLFTAKTAPTISYGSDSYTFTRYVAVTVTPTLGRGVPTSCVSAPALPEGLSIDNRCAISLNPDAEMEETEYTEYVITATNAYGSATVTLSIKVEIDEDEPFVTSSTPGGNATNVPTNPAVITVVFSEAMRTNLVPTLTMESHNGSIWVVIPHAGTILTWTNSTTLKINLSWVYFPETTQLRWTLGSANLQDLAGNLIANDVVRTFTTTARNTYFEIADTGQTSCYYYDNTTWIKDTTCDDYGASTPDKPLGQDAHYDKPKPRSFTFSNANPSGDIVTDNVTKLVWKRCTEGYRNSSCSVPEGTNAWTWPNAINQCSGLNSDNDGAGYAGRKNWRLPTIAELESLPNYSVNSPNPAIDGDFPATLPAAYWSASSAGHELGYAHTVDFAKGTVVRIGYNTPNLHIRCVSGGGSSTTQSFADLGNGTVLDSATNLLWQKCIIGQTGSNCNNSADVLLWNQALTHCATLPLAGKTWRLPNINELKSLVDRSYTEGPFISQNAFPQAPSQPYWSASTSAETAENVWYVDFNDAAVNDDATKDLEISVRCVTDGP